MAKRRYGKKRRGSRSKKVPMAIMVPLAGQAMSSYMASSNPAHKLNNFALKTTGYDFVNGNFNAGAAMPFWGAMVAGIVVHRVAGRTVNRYIPKWIPVSL